VPQGSILGPLFFLFYIDDLPKIIKKDNKIVLFADDTSILITDKKTPDFNRNINQTFYDFNTWFKENLLTLNVSKTQYIEFKTKKFDNIHNQINYEQKYLTNSTETNFLGLIIDDTLSWKQHIEQLASKMSSACYALRNIRHMVSLDILRMIYFAHIHSIVSYCIIFWGNSYYSNKIFILQKKIIRIITNTKSRNSCRELFKTLEIITLYSQYIHSILLFTVKNKYLFDSNNEIHQYRTRHNKDLHLPMVNLSRFKKGAYVSGIKAFNHLPQYIKALVNDVECFKSTLRRFLYQHSFYSVAEYYDYQEDIN
jgi:hypothetical protein